jgi:hypothetical protein
MKIRYGGELQPGDFIMISNGNYTSFGWYFGIGRNTIQYISPHTPSYTVDQYEKYEAHRDTCANWLKKRFENGVTTKIMSKCYVYGEGIGNKGCRVVKIQYPEEIFTEKEDLEVYLKSKDILTDLKFPAK